jgi:hypothetical protein
MSVEFKHNEFLIFIFSKNMLKLVVYSNVGKYDGLLYQEDKECKDSPEVYLSEKIFKHTDLKIEPSSLRRIVSLQNIEKKWKINVMMTTAELPDKFKNEHIEIISLLELPYNCHPGMMWLVPLCIDLSVYGSEFNQILMK